MVVPFAAIGIRAVAAFRRWERFRRVATSMAHFHRPESHPTRHARCSEDRRALHEGGRMPHGPTRLPHWALVLAGGDGMRLRGLTAAIEGRPVPKQYCRIVGDRSMLEATLDRIGPVVPRERTAAVVNRDHLSLARPQLRPLPEENLIVQPRNRDTGPGILLSLLARSGSGRAAAAGPAASSGRPRHAPRSRPHMAGATSARRVRSMPATVPSARSGR